MKRFFLTWAVIYAFNSFTGYIIHHVILGATYIAISGSLQADVQNRIVYFIIMGVTGSFFLVLVYSKWRKSGTVAEGLLYGMIIGTWMGLNMALSVYASTTLIPFSLAAQWLIYSIIQYSSAGSLMGIIYNFKLKTKTI